MVKIMSHITSRLFYFVRKSFDYILIRHNKIQSFENDKIMIPTIMNAFECLKYQFIITSIVNSILYPSINNVQELLKTIIPFFICICLVIFIFKQVHLWLEKVLETKKVLLATNIYLASNIFISILMVFTFRITPEYTDNDRSIALCICFFWIIHSFNLIPGKFIIKLSLYLVTTAIMMIIIKPKWSYGIHVLIGNIIAYIPQIYIIWKKYHNECKIMNEIEYEKNINSFLYNQFPEIILTLNFQYEIIKMNEKGSSLFHHQKFKNFNEFASELFNENNENLYEDLKENQCLDNIQYTRNKGCSNESKIIASSSIFEIEYSKIIILIIRDVTVLYKMQERNISHKYQNILLFSIPHEVRSQLNIISGSMERLEKKFDPEILKIAKYGCKVLEYKLNLLFDFVHCITGKFAAQMKPYIFKDFVSEIFEIIEFFSKAKDIKVIQKFNSTCEKLSFDYERIMAIIIHIALNAIKHTQKGFILINIQYKLGILFVKIKDTGKGMKKSLLENIQKYCNSSPFEPKSIIENALETREENQLLSGLGLLSSSLIAKSLGGEILIDSVENEGTSVLVKIKCHKETNSTKEIFDESCQFEISSDINELKIITIHEFNIICSSSQLSKPTQTCSCMKIIVVDDQKFNRITLIEMLKSLNKYEIYEAENGLEAINAFKSLIVQNESIFIFMDIDMPIMNGIEATQKIKMIDTNNKAKIVMVSAFNTEDVIRDSLAAGAIDFYVKPISFKKLRHLKDSKLLS